MEELPAPIILAYHFFVWPSMMDKLALTQPNPCRARLDLCSDRDLAFGEGGKSRKTGYQPCGGAISGPRLC